MHVIFVVNFVLIFVVSFVGFCSRSTKLAIRFTIKFAIKKPYPHGENYLCSKSDLFKVFWQVLNSEPGIFSRKLEKSRAF